MPSLSISWLVKDLILDSLILPVSEGRHMRCENCVFNAVDIRIGFSTHLIRNEMHC